MREGILKELRVRYNISQKQFAIELGVSQQTIASWEVGRTEPSHTFLNGIADYFGVTTDYLLGRDNEFSVQISDEQMILLNDMEELDTVNKQKVFSYIRDLIRSQRFSRQVKSSTLKTFSARPKIRMRG